jgi:ParB family chromosome partitioning protein
MSEPVSELPIDQIIVGARIRKDPGDVQALADSIAAVGLLQAVAVTPGRKLIAGARRLEAVKSLGWKSIPVRFVGGLDDARLALEAERDENTCRKSLTTSEAVAIGLALEELERPKAKERQAQAGPAEGKGKKVSGSGNLPEPLKGRTRDKIGETVGMSGRNYEKAKAVVKAAEADPLLKPVVAEMDRTGNVHRANAKVREHQASLEGKPDAAARHHGTPDVDELLDLTGRLRKLLGRRPDWAALTRHTGSSKRGALIRALTELIPALEGVLRTFEEAST